MKIKLTKKHTFHGSIRWDYSRPLRWSVGLDISVPHNGHAFSIFYGRILIFGAWISVGSFISYRGNK